MIVKKAGAFEAVITAVDDTLNKVTVLSLGTLAAADAITLNVPSAVTYKERVINNPSRVASWYFNNPVVLDRSSTANPGDVLAVDPCGHVAGVMGRIDANIAIGGVSHAPAGMQFAGLAGIVGLALSISERIDAEPLRKNYINRIQAFPGAGNVIFGGYTAESGTSPIYTADEQLIQVMRSVQYIKASLEIGLRSFLWENFSPETQQEVSRAIESFLRNNIHLFPAGLQESQQFKVISVEPTQNDLDLGLLKVRVQIKPNKAVRFIEVALEFPLPTA
jgi:phage tail sheath protein FI